MGTCFSVCEDMWSCSSLRSLAAIPRLASALHSRTIPLVGRSAPTYSRAVPPPFEHQATLHSPDPERIRPVQGKVRDDRGDGPVLCRLEAELVVEVERCCCDEDGGVAEGEADIGVVVGLVEVEGCEVVCEGVVGGVFEVWREGGG